ncbi:hypothetical protein ACGFJT_37515 [Actinomadura geliboluensis]|uniref:hypothetical protein n=1 Tax=Actinomadura geliboluensis TaxID=882440 RepID=UPI003719838C
MPVPTEPASWQSTSFGVPAGFDAPVYAADLDGWAVNLFPHDLRTEWPPVPATLATDSQLAAAGLRPRHALVPDGYQIGPCHVNGRPVSFDWNVLDPADRNIAGQMRRAAGLAMDEEQKDDFPDDRYPVWPLYRLDHARLRTASPSAGDRHAERRAVAEWAAAAVADPATVVVAASSIPAQSVAGHGRSGESPVLVELAACTAGGKSLLDTVVNPGWKPGRSALTPLGLTATQLRAAPSFADVRDRMALLLEGRRVVCTDRARIYGLLFAELEYAAEGYCYPNGSLWTDSLGEATRGVLSRSRWECLRLAYSRFVDQWDDQQRPVMQAEGARPRRAAGHARRAARELCGLASLARRYLRGR